MKGGGNMFDYTPEGVRYNQGEIAVSHLYLIKKDKKTNRKKTMNIVVERNGSLCVLAPEKLEEEKILDILDKKEYEITKKIIHTKSTEISTDVILDK